MEDKIVDIPGLGQVAFPGNMSDSEINSAAKKLYEQSGAGKPLTAGEVATGAIVNFPSSFKNLIGNIVEAVTSPVQTAKSVLDVGAGALQNVLPEKFVQAVGEDKQSREMARKVGQFYADRYGTGEGLKRAIAEDPAGVLADLSTVLTGGATAAPRAIAQPLSTAARTIDPLAAAVRGTTAAAQFTGRNVIAPTLGLTTGVGEEAIRQAERAGRVGGETARAFRENISGRADITEALDLAKQSLDEMRSLKNAQYRSGMVNIKNDKSVLDFANIDKAIGNAESSISYKGVVKDDKAAAKLAEVKDEINAWKQRNPQDFHTPEGMDALKQKVGALLEEVPFEARNVRRVVGGVYDTIRNEIKTQAPTYDKVMKDYTNASNQITEIERSLSLGRGASADTALRKLQSLMRNNVNTNYSQRTKLAKQMEQMTGKEIMPSLAGQALSQITPRGLQRATTIPTGGAAYYLGGIPAAGISLAASSPRLMGEAAYATGLVGRGVETLGRQVPFAVNPELYNLLYQSGQTQGLLGE